MPKGVRNSKDEEIAKVEDEVVEQAESAVEQTEQEIDEVVENTQTDDGSPVSESEQEPAQEEDSGLPDSTSEETPEVSTETESDSNQENSDDLNQTETSDKDVTQTSQEDEEPPSCNLCGSILNLIVDSEETECSNQDCENSATQKQIKVDAEAKAKADEEAAATTVTDPEQAPEASTKDEVESTNTSGYDVGAEILLKLPTIRIYATSVAVNYIRKPGPLYIYDTLVQHDRIRVTDKPKDGAFVGWVAFADMAK